MDQIHSRVFSLASANPISLEDMLGNFRLLSSSEHRQRHYDLLVHEISEFKLTFTLAFNKGLDCLQAKGEAVFKPAISTIFFASKATHVHVVLDDVITVLILARSERSRCVWYYLVKR